MNEAGSKNSLIYHHFEGTQSQEVSDAISRHILLSLLDSDERE
jgi:hypothetical protein